MKNWGEAELNLIENIRINDHLDLYVNVNYKVVTQVPPYLCKNHNNEVGFRIQVGKTNYINIPIGMLQKVFEATLLNNDIYHRGVFKNLYPIETQNKPCYIHAVAKLFVFAGIMKKISPRSYKLYPK